ncbi:hypothetical protein DFR30_0183 [Thiogranum longum]|uniref:Uncharacterized protein n=1 Tax=Thiogranum longum TaxID=1537524 RepID=A0A4R1H929_9GAMM|nr:hypothetical protein [Thiogranum longum]TCK16963.1 hypothetical protein DFR30_0183 [Thiogranum longum]
MKIEGALSQAITGIQRGLSSARDNAEKIANAGTGNPADLVEPMVGLKLDTLQVQASAEVLKAVDKMLGSLFDEEA